MNKIHYHKIFQRNSSFQRRISLFEIIIFFFCKHYERDCAVSVVRTLLWLYNCLFPTAIFFIRASFLQISQSNEVSIANNSPCECTQGNSSPNQHRHRRSLKRHSSFAVDVNLLPFAFHVCRFFLPPQRPRTNSFCLSRTRFSWE